MKILIEIFNLTSKLIHVHVNVLINFSLVLHSLFNFFLIIKLNSTCLASTKKITPSIKKKIILFLNKTVYHDADIRNKNRSNIPKY